MPEQSPTRFTMVPARRSNEPTARRRARRILSALFLAAALSVAAVLVAMAKGRNEPDLSAVDPKGRDLAYAAAVNFLAGEQQNVPHADSFDPEEASRAAADLYSADRRTAMSYRSLNWVGFSPQNFGSKKAGFTKFQVHHFLVVLDSPSQQAPEKPRAPRGPGARTAGASQPSPASQGGGQNPAPGQSPNASSPGAPATDSTPPPSANASPSPSPSDGTDKSKALVPPSNVLQLDVPVLLGTQGPLLAASPAFSAWTSGSGKIGGRGDYTNYSNLTVDVGDSMKGQIARWAKAYVTGDSAGLLALTGDQDGKHRYLGLSGFTLPDSNQAVQIQSAIKAGGGQVIVRVRILLARTAQGGTVSDERGSSQQARLFATYADFDLLVGAPTGAQPPILAWGPAGSAAELEPYSNALTS